MNILKINTEKCKSIADSLLIIQKSILQIQGNIGVICQNLSEDSIYRHVEAKIQQSEKNIETLSTYSQQMHDILVNIIGTYENTENKLLNSLNNKNRNGSSEPFDNHAHSGYSVDSIVFDDEGSYGGDQGHMEQVYFWNPIKCWELLKYLREYYPDMSIFEAFKYFSHLNSVGCGYVALANTIFMEYEDRPEEFERTFGYPMFDKNSDLNYDRLILDIYATTDLAGINDAEDGYPSGTTDAARAEIMETFLSNKDINVTTQADVKVTPENFQSIIENGGYVVLGYRNGYMYDENNNPHYIDGGHAITVTGVTEDGRFIVSSWGEKYYIDPADLNSVDEEGNRADSFMIFYYN